MQESIEFTIPEGYKLDPERSTPEKLVYRLKEKSIAKNWEEVCEVMFPIGGNLKYMQNNGQVGTIYITSSSHRERNNVTSKAQGEKLMAINQLMTVAKYLNDLDCFENDYKLMGIYIIPVEGLRISPSNSAIVSFKGKERASQAIKILGEDVIRLALTPNNY